MCDDLLLIAEPVPSQKCVWGGMSQSASGPAIEVELCLSSSATPAHSRCKSPTTRSSPLSPRCA